MNEQPIDSSERAADLRDRLIQVAYALHFSAADAAALFERNAAAAPLPTQRDPALWAKRWRTVSEQALDLVQTWEQDDLTMPPTSSRGQRATHRITGSRNAAELPDAVVEHLFAAGLHLQDLVEHAEGPARRQVGAALDEIEEAIRTIRSVAFDAARRRHARNALLG